MSDETMLRVWPCTVKQAVAYVHEHHRHLPNVGGAMFACAIGYGPARELWRGVGLVGCGAQEWEGTGRAATSLRAAAFQDMGLSSGGEWDRESRPRAPAVRADTKRRWRRSLADLAPWPSVACRDEAVDPQQTFAWEAA